MTTTAGSCVQFLVFYNVAPVAGSATPQRFIAYGALFGAPLMDDNLVVSRKDFT